MIKYLGSKRALMPRISSLVRSSPASTALDLFTGTTRVARMFKNQGRCVTAVDTASYSHVFAKTWIELDASSVSQHELTDALEHLRSLPDVSGYFTKTFCEDARYFQAANGRRIDAMREAIESDYRETWLYEPLLTSLIMAADRVDSTTGVQMAYLKEWSARSFRPLSLQDPGLLPGGGSAIMGDAAELAPSLPPVDLAYLDPPYNQHRYFGNYHVWESLVRWDKPQTYGVANKRVDARDSANKSAFNSKPAMPAALAKVIQELRAEVILLSYNNEAWLDLDELMSLFDRFDAVASVEIDSKRYIGSQIGVYNKAGELVGTPGHKRNTEYILIAGPRRELKRMRAAN